MLKAIELCCGHAGLTATLWDVGFQAMGIDWIGNRHQPMIPITKIDLASPEGQQQAWELLQDLDVRYIHMGPPCGTFSAARNIPIPELQIDVGAPNPQPLRSRDELLGRTDHNFSEQEQVKV